jgi:hypothetical protein
MAKRTVRLTESELKQMISESVKRVLKETNENPNRTQGRKFNIKRSLTMDRVENMPGEEEYYSRLLNPSNR